MTSLTRRRSTVRAIHQKQFSKNGNMIKISYSHVESGVSLNDTTKRKATRSKKQMTGRMILRDTAASLLND